MGKRVPLILCTGARRYSLFCPGKNDRLNLRGFSETVQRYFEGQFIAAFTSWENSACIMNDWNGNGKYGPERTGTPASGGVLPVNQINADADQSQCGKRLPAEAVGFPQKQRGKNHTENLYGETENRDPGHRIML